MVRHNIKNFIWVLVFLSLVTFLIIYYVQGHNAIPMNIKLLFGDISKTVFVLTLISSLFISFGWKWRIFKGWLVVIPDLSGKWIGIMYSNYKNPPLEISTEIEIFQTFFHTTVKLKTGESQSVSLVASFDIDKDKGIKRLIYSYHNIPKATVQDRSAIHYGTTILDISEDEAVLNGFYWTNRATKGDMKFKKVR